MGQQMRATNAMCFLIATCNQTKIAPKKPTINIRINRSYFLCGVLRVKKAISPQHVRRTITRKDIIDEVEMIRKTAPYVTGAAVRNKAFGGGTRKNLNYGSFFILVYFYLLTFFSFDWEILPFNENNQSGQIKSAHQLLIMFRHTGPHREQ